MGNIMTGVGPASSKHPCQYCDAEHAKVLYWTYNMDVYYNVQNKFVQLNVLYSAHCHLGWELVPGEAPDIFQQLQGPPGLAGLGGYQEEGHVVQQCGGDAPHWG